MKSFKKLIALVLTFAITLAYVPATASFADGQTLVATSSANASENASDNASKDASKDATTVATATTEAASAEASKEAASGDASKDAASADASKEASANATGTTETAIVSITFANAGKVVVGNDADKTLLASQQLKVTDADKDGKLTIYDAFSIADTTYNLGGFAPPRSEPNKTKKNCFLTFHMSGWCQTLLLDSQKSPLSPSSLNGLSRFPIKPSKSHL